jgi:hypothetical protein
MVRPCFYPMLGMCCIPDARATKSPRRSGSIWSEYALEPGDVTGRVRDGIIPFSDELHRKLRDRTLTYTSGWEKAYHRCTGDHYHEHEVAHARILGLGRHRHRLGHMWFLRHGHMKPCRLNAVNARTNSAWLSSITASENFP